MVKIDRQLYVRIGQQLRKAREDNDMTLEYVAERIGRSKKTIQRYETAESRIDTETLKNVCKVVGLDAAQIMQSFTPDRNIDIYGDHQANLVYFAKKPELLEIYKEIHESENLKLLFDSAKDLTPEDLEYVLNLIKRLKDSEG